MSTDKASATKEVESVDLEKAQKKLTEIEEKYNYTTLIGSEQFVNFIQHLSDYKTPCSASELVRYLKDEEFCKKVARDLWDMNIRHDSTIKKTAETYFEAVRAKAKEERSLREKYKPRGAF